jgi:pimeloyl-ACP methyl ester carboxylesterase
MSVRILGGYTSSAEFSGIRDIPEEASWFETERSIQTLRNANIPVFWLHGANDEVIPLAKVQDFLEQEGVALEIVENHGHKLNQPNSCRRFYGMWREYQKSFGI